MRLPPEKHVNNILKVTIFIKISTLYIYYFHFIGIANTVGRLVIGGLTTLISNKRLLLHNMALFIASVTVFVLPLLTRYSELLVFGVLYGMCLGKVTCFFSLVLLYSIKSFCGSNKFTRK